MYSRVDEFQSTVDGASDDGSIADLDNWAVEEAGIGEDRSDYLIAGGVFGQQKLLELRLFFTKKIESRNAELRQEFL